MINRLERAFSELREHLPYTIFAALGGIGLLGLINFSARLIGQEALLPEASVDLFHSLHFLHLFLSAMTTTVMFWRHDRHLLKSIVIGVLGAAILCGTSDILFPLIGGWFLAVPMVSHICFIEHPILVWPFLLAGTSVGLLLPPFKQSTHMAHGGHVFLSSAASLFYLLSFGQANWIQLAAPVFIILVFAVMIPCCASDIFFPLMFTRSEREGSHDACHRSI